MVKMTRVWMDDAPRANPCNLYVGDQESRWVTRFATLHIPPYLFEDYAAGRGELY